MSDAEIYPTDNHLQAGGENGLIVNGQLSNDAQNSDSSALTGKSTNYQKTKDSRSQQQIDRIERLRLIKERQNEEKQKKLEELRQQVLAAQRSRERSEEERRRRIESLRNREMDKRHQVEERKRLIMEAERDRMEAILRRNQEREARIESKRKMERSSIVFAFGSSTPRMLESQDGGSTYWASRRATSTTNVMSMSVMCPGPLTRRSSERELTNNNKKRATSAGGLIDHKNVDGSRSEETTPRPPSALSQHNGNSSVSSTVRPRPATAPIRKPRPNSIAITGVTSSADVLKCASGTKSPMIENRLPVSRVHVTKKSTSKIDAGRKTDRQKSSRSSQSSTTPKETPSQSPTIELSAEDAFSASESGERHSSFTVAATTVNSSKAESVTGASSNEKLVANSMTTDLKSECSTSSEAVNDLAECDMTGSMTSSQIKRVTTEEEAKAALAERRRLAREQAEREAELEQQRLKAEKLAEEERLRKEEEEQRRMEEEQLRLIEEAKKAEEERLLQAIEETKKREEEERHRKEEELKLKLEKEEADRKAKEEAERLRQEMELKLKKEEEDRQARRKRVAAIMSRTRATGGTPAATPTKEDNSDIIEDKLNRVSDEVISDSQNDDRNNENDTHLISVECNDMKCGTDVADNMNHKQNGVQCTIESHNVTNNLLDLTDFNVINTNIISDSAVSPQIIDLQVGKDNYNSKELTDLLS